jgi:hypothetical protein
MPLIVDMNARHAGGSLFGHGERFNSPFMTSPTARGEMETGTMARFTGKTSGSRRRARLTALTFVAAILTVPAVAAAQQEHHGNGNGNGSGAPQQQRPAAPPPPPAAPPRAAAAPGWGRPAVVQPRPAVNGGGWQPRPQGGYAAGRPQPGYQPNRTPGGQYSQAPAYGRPDGGYRNPEGRYGRSEGGYPRPQGGHGGPEGGYGRSFANGQWNHGWRQDNRYDWRGWREQNGQIFHSGRYYPPYRGYLYNRLAVGYYLPAMFFANDYWVENPDYYHLPPVYGPLQWVRYYNDVLLVDTDTGQVVDVIYDFFW